MKKIILSILAICSLSSAVNAQSKNKDLDGSEIVIQGDHLISIGYGFPSFIRSTANLTQIYTSQKTSGFGPLHLKYEYAFADSWTIGLSSNIDHTQISYIDYNNVSYNDSYTAIAFNVRFNKYLIQTDKVGIYMGLGAGYNFTTFGGAGEAFDGQKLYHKTMPLSFEATAGAKLFITPNIGFYTEFGWAKDLLQVGLTFRNPGKH